MAFGDFVIITFVLLSSRRSRSTDFWIKSFKFLKQTHDYQDKNRNSLFPSNLLSDISHKKTEE